MDTKGQLKLLLWKDFLIRRRHLGVASLVFGWAIAVFLVLYIVRESLDPEYSPTCSYTARALPSTGLFPFVQSFLCNIDNKCNNISQYEEVPQYKNARLTGVANQLQTIFTNKTIINVVKSLPDMIELLKAVGNGLDSPELEGIFGPGIQISNLFLNPESVKKQITDSNTKLNVEILDDVFNASLKLGHLFESFGNTDLGSSICEPDKLEKYLILQENGNIKEVSASLCNIDGSHVPNLIQNVFENVDFSGLLNSVGKVVNRFTNYSIFDDIRSLTNVILDLNLIKDSAPKNLKLKAWLPDVIAEMKNLNKTHLDSNYVQKSLKIIEPHFTNEPLWPKYRNLITNIMSLLKNIQDKILLRGFERNNKMNQGPKDFSEFVTNLRTGIEKLRNPSKEDILQKEEIMFQIANDTLNAIPAFYSNDSKPWLYLANILDSLKVIINNENFNKISEISNIYSKAISALHYTIKGEFESEKIMYQLCEKHSNTVSTLFSLGPEFITSMLNCFSNITCTSMIVENKNNISEIFCNKEKTEEIIPEASSIKNIGILCNIELNSFIEDLNNDFNLDWVNKTFVDLQSNTEDTFSNAVINTENLVKYIRNKKKIWEEISLISWDQLFPDIDNMEWKIIISEAKKNAGLYMINVQLSFLKNAVSKDVKFNKIFNATSTLMEGLLAQYNLIPKQLINLILKNLPSILETILTTFTNKTQLMALTSINDWEQYYCNNATKNDIISKIICEKLSFINLQNNLPWYEHPLISSIYSIIKNTNESQEINWDKFIINAQNMYLTISDILNMKYPKYNWNEKDVFKSKFWMNWSQSLDVETEMHFGLQIVTKIADFVEINYLDQKTQHYWRQIRLVTTAANSFLILVMDIIDFSIESQNSQKDLQNLYPITFELSTKIIKNLNNVTHDLETYLEDETFNVMELINWFENPCIKNITDILTKLSSASQIALLGIQNATCNHEKYEMEWKMVELATHQLNNTVQDKQFQYTITKFAKLLHNIKKMKHDPMVESHDSQHLDLIHAGIQLEKTIMKIADKYLEKNIMRQETLNVMWLNLKKCRLEGKICTKIELDTARYTSKFIASSINEVATQIIQYINLLNATEGVDPLRLIGFSNLSGIYRFYLKLSDFIKVFINSYRSTEFERKIFENQSTGINVRCTDIMENLIIPNNNSVTEDDITALKGYLCPSIFDWPILHDNIFLETVNKIQDMFLETPVSQFNISFVAMSQNLFNLKAKILNFATYGHVNIIELWNKLWTNDLEKTFNEIKNLEFTQKNTISRYFKYIDQPSDKFNLSQRLVNPKYGFGDFSYLLQEIKYSLNNFTSLDVTSTDLQNSEDIKQLKNLLDIYTKQFASFFSYLYVRFAGDDFWEHFEDFCNSTDTLNDIDVFVPAWINEDDDKILDRLCKFSDKNIRNDMIPINQLSNIKNYNVVLEDVIIQFLSTLINSLNNETNINISSLLKNHFDLSKILNSTTFPSESEIRNTSLIKAHNLSTQNIKYLINFDETLKLSTTFLIILQGGDWWNSLLNNVPDSNIKFWLRIFENAPQIILHLADASISPHLLYDITSMVVTKGPLALCDKNFELDRYLFDNNILSIAHEVCDFKANADLEIYEVQSDNHGTKLILKEEKLAEHITNFEKSLIDLIKQGPKKFDLPKWMNETEILQQYKDYAKLNKKPLKLLQTVTTVLNEIIDIGSVFYKNQTNNCTWCTWGTIFVREAGEHLSKAQKYTEFLCDATDMNFTEIKNTLINDFKWGEFYQDLFNNKTYKMNDFDREVHDIVEVIRVQLITFFTNKTLQELPVKCFNKIVNTPSLRNISTYITALKEISKTLKTSSISFLNSSLFNMSSQRLTNLMEEYIPIPKPIQSILNDTFDFTEKLLNLNVDNITINELINSKVDINMLEKIHNEHDMEIYLQNKILFQKLFTFNNLTNERLIYQNINNHNISEIADILFYSIDQENVNEKIAIWRNESLKSLDWVTRIFEKFEEVIGNGGNLLEFISNIDFSGISTGNINISNMLKGVLELLEKNSIEKLFQSLRELVKNMAPIIRNEKLEKDLYDLLNGIENLDIFKNLGLLRIKYDIPDLIQNWPGIEKYLIQEVKLSPKVVKDLLNASIDLSEIMSAQGDDLNIHQMICDPEELTKLVNFNAENSQKIAERVSTEICNLNFNDIENIAVHAFKNINLTHILNSIMNSTIDTILTSAHMTQEEGQNVVKNIGIGAELLPHLKEMIKNISGDVKSLNFDHFKSDASSMVVSPDLLASASTLLCGRPLVQTSSKLYKVISEAKDFNADEYSIIEKKTLPSDFCRNLYNDIVNMDAGKLIWAYIKPLLRGKILYTPNVPVVQNILEKANTTFNSIAELQDILTKITSGLTALEDRENLEHMLDNIQNFLNSSIVQMAVQGVIKSVTKSEISLRDVNLKDILNNFGDSTKISSALKFGSDFLNCVLLNRFVGVDSEAELEDKAKHLMQSNEFIAGIVFLNLNNRKKRSIDEIPRDVEYKIRMDIDSVPSTSLMKYKFWTPGPENDFLDELRYFRGFIQLQDLIDNAIMQMKSSDLEEIPKWETLTQEMPYPCYTRDFFKSALAISQTFQVCFFFGFIAIIAAAVRYIVWEKESGNTMVMNVMGLQYITHCTSWFIVTFIEMLFTMICILIIIKVGGILPKSNAFLLFLYMIEYGFSIIMFCYMISSIFDSASLAAVGSAIFYLLSYMPFIIIIALETSLSLWAKMLTNISMSTSFCYGCLYIIRFELQGVGLQWNNSWDTPIPGDKMSFGTTCLFLLFDGILYGIIGYLCSRKSQELHKIFKFLPSWLFTNSYQVIVDTPTYITFGNELFIHTSFAGENYLQDTVSQSNIVNDEPLKIGVTIKSLTKIYNNRKKTVKAIEDIDITLYTGQVTTLLGHNGAGKTTLIKILTGMMQPTSGQIIINSEITEQCNTATRFLGVCPQGSVLINTMSALEHLIFYAKLKTSKSTPQVMPEVMDMIDSLSLGYLSNEPVSHLSEGMRRRLCVAIAFIGKPKLVVLDEPSSGVDPVARRQIWDLVIRYKEGCTVLLTTHYLDEAELLSDRVVVLHKGNVLCSGSPLILRQSYGTGYKITVTYPETKEKQELNNNNSQMLLSIVNKIASNASLGDIRKFEVDIIIPFNSTDGIPNNFEEVAKILEENQSTLGFVSFSMNCSTLEQVFLDLCAKADAKILDQDKTDTISQIGKSYSSVFSNSVEEIPPMKDQEFLLNTGEKLTGSNCAKFLMLLKKRAIHCMYDWRVIICALVLPTLFTAVAMGFSLIRPPNSNEPELKLSPELYHPHTTSFISVHTDDMTSFVNRVSREIVGLSPHKNLELYTKSYRDCVCQEGMQKCSKPSNSTHDALLKLSNVHESIDWLIETQNEYIEQRYGGWSLSDQFLNKSAMVVWYNNKGYHSMPAYLNTMNSAILRTISPGSSITTYSHPLKLSVDQLSKSTIIQHIADVGIAMVLLIAFSLVPASGSMYLVQERVNEEKRLQFLCGVSPTLYWIVALFWDILVLLCSILLAVIVFKIFGLPVYVERDNMAAVALLIFLYGWACIPFVHLCQRLFNDASMANMVLFCVCTFIGIAELTCLLLMDILGKTQFVADFRDVLHKIYLIFPQFVLGDGLVEISKNNIQAEILERFHMDTYVSPLSWELMGLHYLSLGIMGVILFLINLIIENEWFKSFKKSSIVYPTDTACLEIVSLTKTYNTNSGKHLAVNDVSLKVPFGECLGLIGVNGAGKSTTFKMLTTELRPSSGKIFLQGREICKKPLYTGEMGYCPQCDSLDPKLTVRETLKLYLTLRGIDNQNEILNKMMMKFELSNYANRKNENLSGGNKRKLCAALSVLGRTSLVLMDEPTSGMDPHSRNLVALTIQQLTRKNRSVILTSHSVEDCETMCSKIAVMINGKIICEGTPQDLKERYGSGYIISVRLTKSTEQELLLELMKKHFPGSELMSRQYCSSQFSVPTDKTKISDMFNKMAKISEYVSVEDFNLVQSSLDQVFINLANKSEDSNGYIESQKELPNMYSMDEI